MNTLVFQALFYWYRFLHPTIKCTPRLVVAQAVLESANFTSHVYQANNNCLGMKAPSARDTTATNKGGSGYAMYDSPLDCVADWFMWADAWGIKTDADLQAFLGVGFTLPSGKVVKYAEDGKYYSKVERVMNELAAAGKLYGEKKALATTGAALAALGLVGVGVAKALK